MKRNTLALPFLFAMILLPAGKRMPPRINRSGHRTTTSDDSTSVNKIIKAVYEVISGPAGHSRDWNRFRSLLAPGAHLIRTSVSSGGTIQITVLTPEDYIQRYGPALENNGSFEQEIARRMEQFAHVAEVFTIYESRHQQEEKHSRAALTAFN